jgi:hypothetical protein
MKNNQNSDPNFVPSVLKVVASEECANSVANDLTISEGDKSIEDLLNDQQKEEPQENSK